MQFIRKFQKNNSKKPCVWKQQQQQQTRFENVIMMFRCSPRNGQNAIWLVPELKITNSILKYLCFSFCCLFIFFFISIHSKVAPRVEKKIIKNANDRVCIVKRAICSSIAHSSHTAGHNWREKQQRCDWYAQCICNCSINHRQHR